MVLGDYENRIVLVLGAVAHVEVVSLLQKMSNTRERTITLDVEMEDYDVELTYKKKAEE